MKKEKTDKELLTSIEKFSATLEASGLKEYIEDSKYPWRIIWRNLLAGIARGVGLTVGATLIVAILLKVLYMLIYINVPYLTDMLKELVIMIKSVN